MLSKVRLFNAGRAKQNKKYFNIWRYIEFILRGHSERA